MRSAIVKNLVFLLVLLGISFGTWCQPGDVFRQLNLNDVNIKGYAGNKIDACIKNDVLHIDPDYLVQPFTKRNETWQWQSEFWGKWITSAIDAYRYNKDAALLNNIKRGVSGLIATQTPDGYIGNYEPASRLKQWDIWGMKYCLLGLIDYYDLTKDVKSLDAAKKLADYVIGAVYAAGKPFHEFGNHRGMAAASILEPMMQLYNITKKKNYLDFAEFIVKSWSAPGASELIKMGLDKIPVGDRFPTPAVWYGPLQGKKAYEMMSCYEGLMELYRVKGKPEYLQAIVNTAQNIAKDEIFITGSGAAMECWLNGAHIQSTPIRHPNETCVTATWMKFCYQLLRATGDVKWANEIEKTFYNALLGAMKPDGSTWNKYTDLRGIKYLGDDQCGMNINCCVANGPRGLMIVPKQAFMKYENGIVVNFYGDASTNVSVGKSNIALTMQSNYPRSGKTSIRITPAKPSVFGLKLRIPEWAHNTTINVNGELIKDVLPGTYKEISRRWQKGDIVELNTEMAVEKYFIPGDSTNYALLYGPLVLASDSRFQSTPFFNYYTPIVEKGSIPFEIQKPSQNNFFQVKIPFMREIIGGTDQKEDLVLVDFASAGNTWDATSAYLTWFLKPKDPAKAN